VVYFVGCVGSFYPRAYSIPQALVQTLDRGGVDFTTLGGEEWCCGYPLYVAGIREQMAEMARHNLERVRAVEARRVIFTCPSCYCAWSHLYPEMADVSGLELQHATEFLAELLAGGGLALGPVEEMVTYHACQQCKRTLQEGARKNRIRVRAMDVVEILWQSVQAAEE
jgi:heterodisulfide reductase subunit D